MSSARSIYDQSIVIDAHNDMASKVLDNGYDPDVAHPAGDGSHIDLPRLISSGVTAAFFASWVDAKFTAQSPDGSFARALAGLDVVHAFVARHPERLTFATTGDDVREAKRARKIAVFAAVEGGHAIEDSLDKLHALHERGARYLTLTWNNGNAWAGSSNGMDGTRTGGLTAFGREVIREMNRLGMIVDVSHVSGETLADVLAVSDAPVIASHSGARALNDHTRNLTDDQIRAIAASGGVVSVNFYPKFLDRRYPEPMPIDRVIDHIEHIARVAGVEHVGLGSDFDGISAVPVGLADVSEMPRVAEVLLDRGWSAAEMARVLGLNVLRLL
jgi:membrane dipeptidase